MEEKKEKKKGEKIEKAESVERIDDNRGLNRKQQTANGNDAFARVARSSPACMYTQKSELARSRQKLTVDSPGGRRGVE